MKTEAKTIQALTRENEELRARLAQMEEAAKRTDELHMRLSEAEEALAAIRNGEVDALLISRPEGDGIYTLEGADTAYRVMVENMREGAVTLLADGSILYANQRFAEIVGQPLEQIIGTPLGRFVHPNDQNSYQALRRESHKNHGSGEIRLLGKDGRTIYVNLSLNILEQQGVQGTCVVVTDLSAQEWLRTALTSIGDAVIACDTQSRITFVNPVAAALTGWSADEAIGQPIANVFRIVNEKTHQPADDIVARVLRERRAIELSNHTALVTRDGREIPVEDSASPILDSAGDVTGVVLVFHEVTGKRRAQEALLESEERYRGVVQNTSAIILRVAPSGVINFANERALEFFGYSAEELIGKHAIGTIVPERETTGRDLAAMVDQIIQNPDRFHSNANENMRKNGERVWVEWTNSGIYDTDGCLKEFLSVGIDATEQKKAQETLRKNKETLRVNQEELKVQNEELQQAQSQLEDSRKKYFDLFELAPIGYLTIDHHGLISEANLKISELLGTPRARLMERLFTDFVLKEDRDRYYAHLKQAQTTAQLQTCELRLKEKRQDQVLHIQMQTLAHAEPGQGQTQYRVAIMDITDRKRAEDLVSADLQATKRLQQVGARAVQPDSSFDVMLGEFVEAAIVLTGADKGNMQLFDASTSSLKIKAHRGFEEPFLRFFDTVHDEPSVCGAAMARGARVIVEDVTQSPIFIGTPALAVLLEAGVRTVQSTPLVSSAGHLLGMISTHFSQPHGFPERDLRLMDLLARQAADFIERKRTEEALRQSERLYKSIGESLIYGIWICNPQGGVEYVSQSFLDLCEQTMEEHRGFGWTHRLPPDEVEPMLKKWLHCCATGEDWDYEHHVLGPDGQYHTILSRGKPIRDEQGNIGCWAGINLDITDRKRMEEDLKQHAASLANADRRKDEFLAMLAHELRNPLAPVRYAVQIMNAACGADCPKHEHVAHQYGIIERQIGHMARLIDDLLDVARITSGKIKLRRDMVDLNAALRQSIESCRPALERKNQELITNLLGEPLWLEGDPTRLEQVFTNVMGNAGKYSPAGTRIWISVSPEHDDGEKPVAVVRVRDEGEGISAELLPHVFDLFRQAERGKDRAQGGLGIGLTMVQKLIEMHGGTVEARSEGAGKGSEFVVRLPLTLDAAGAATCEAVASKAVRSFKILVVDDLVDSARSLAELLEVYGHQARVAFDGLTALEIARTFRPDLVLLDIGMPGMNGFEVARRLRAEHGKDNMTLIALTGYGQDCDRAEAREAGFDDLMVKPVDLDALRAALEKITAQQGS